MLLKNANIVPLQGVTTNRYPVKSYTLTSNCTNTTNKKDNASNIKPCISVHNCITISQD